MSIQSEMTRITNNVANAYAALETLGADMPSEQTSDNLLATIGTTKAVLYTEQILTEEQKAQVRKNIGITSSSNNNVGQTTEQGGEIFNDYVNNQATGPYAHSEGEETTAEGDGSHAEGLGTNAMGAYSHAEGIGTITDATAAHASGYYTSAGYDYQFVCGMHNSNKEDTLFEVGNGSHVGEEGEGYYFISHNLSDLDKNRIATECYYIGELYNKQDILPLDTTVTLQLITIDNVDTISNSYMDPTYYEKRINRKLNAFEVYRDGHAEVQTMGTTGNSVVARKSVIPKRVQSLEEFEDLEQIYALPNGHIYKYKQEEVVPGVPTFTNRARTAADPFNQNKLLNGVGYKYNVDYDFDWDTKTIIEQPFIPPAPYLPGYVIGAIRVTDNDIIRIKKIGFATNGGTEFIKLICDGYGCEGIRNTKLSQITAGGGHYTITGSNSTAILEDVEIHVNSDTFGWVVNGASSEYYVVFYSTVQVNPDEIEISVNEELTYTEEATVTGWIKTNDFYNTPDYLNKMAALELRIMNLEAALAKLSQ